MKIIPNVQSFKKREGYFSHKNFYEISTFKIDPVFDDILSKLKASYHISLSNNGDIVYVDDQDLDTEEYEIDIGPKQIIVYSSTTIGAFYATSTVVQILNQETECGHIHDYPDLSLRGIMLDISRDKVPTIDTLKQIVDKLAFLKYNHLELYIEGFSFEYGHFNRHTRVKKNYIKLKDYLEIQLYARKHFIDFVPNQNGFGHMTDWLKVPMYANLGCLDLPFSLWGSFRDPSTLDPTNDKSIELVKKMYDDMLPYSLSDYFNMDFDEPFELGYGKSEALCKEIGVGRVYLNYFKKLYDHVKSYRKTPMLWGDVILKHPEVIPDFPKDAILIDWGYDHKYDYETHGKILEDAKVKFAFAPASSTWGSFVGKYIDMTGSILHAAQSMKAHHGEGLILTDWGDIGHLQYLPATYPGMVYSSAMAWHKMKESDIEYGVGLLIDDFKLAHIIVELSKFHKLEGPYIGYGCRLFSTILWADNATRLPNKEELFFERMKYNLIEKGNVRKLSNFLTKYEDELNEMVVDGDNLIIVKELLSSIYLMKTLLKINVKLAKAYDHKKVKFNDELEALKIAEEKHLEVWNMRNIENGYKYSVERIKQLERILEHFKNNLGEETK